MSLRHKLTVQSKASLTVSFKLNDTDATVGINSLSTGITVYAQHKEEMDIVKEELLILSI